jgi:ATP-binding cassette, subfamily B, bacterial MsbA
VKLRHRLLLRLLRYLKPHWPTVVAGGLLALVVSGAGGLIAWLVKPAMDDIFLRRDLVMLKLIPLALLGVYLVKGATSYGESYLMASVGERVVAQLRRELYVHIQGMPLSFFSTRHSGELTTRLVLDVNRIAALASNVLVSTLRRAGTIVALLAVMLTHDWLLTLMAAAMVPVAGIVNWPLGRQLYRINRRAQELSGALSVLLLESLTGRKIVKAFGREHLEQARFDTLNHRRLRLALRDHRVDELSRPLLEVVAAFGIIGALWYGGSRVIEGTLTPGEFFSFTAAVALLYRPLGELLRTLNTVQQSVASVERVFEILDTPPAIVDAPGARELGDFSDRIVFEGAGFRYPGAEDWALRDVTLTIRKGELIAFVGMSGAGKTTLMELLPRFHDVSEGRITIDGHDLRTVTMDSLRALIGIVTQDTFLFRDSIEYNIAYGKPGATREAIEHAARLAQAHDFIAALPEGYAASVGERGVKLSGGQRQRLAIARAFLKDPPILILDEATADLDAESESLVQRALSELLKGRTVLVIAHRLATVKHADRVVVIHGGRIVETGGHSELIASVGGIYRGLAALQRFDVAGG